MNKDDRIKYLVSKLYSYPRVAFDLDGTLYDARDFERAALTSVSDWLQKKSGRNLDTLQDILIERRENNRKDRRLFDNVLIEFGLPIAWKYECINHFLCYEGDELARSESLKSELLELRKAGCRIALVSNGHALTQIKKIQKLNLDNVFDQCVFCDPKMAYQLKPSSWAWSQLAAWRGNNKCIFIGDDPVDEEFAKSGNSDFISFSFKSSKYDH